MSKGNLFLGYARGKVGSVVFSRLFGEQITRAYNGKPANPKSYDQAKQRMLLASVSQYVKAWRYIIEQGQAGVQTGSTSVRWWQSKVLKQLAQTIGSVNMLPNAKGWQFAQGLPVSLTSGTLPSLDYSIRQTSSSAGNYLLCMDFKKSLTSQSELTSLTLGQFLALYPGIQKSAQFTIVQAFHGEGYMDTGELANVATKPCWSQFVIAADADESLPFFTAVPDTQYYTINPAILASSWGGNTEVRFSPRSYTEDGNTFYVMSVAPAGLVTDASFPVAGAIITSYYNGSEWNRSESPMAVLGGTNVDDYINTYMAAAASVRSNLYLNQAEPQRTITGNSTIIMAVTGQDGTILKSAEQTTLNAELTIDPQVTPLNSIYYCGVFVDAPANSDVVLMTFDSDDEASAGSATAGTLNGKTFVGFKFEGSPQTHPAEGTNYYFKYRVNSQVYETNIQF